METNIFKNCRRCGKEFSAERNSAKYCGNTCKTMANRERRKNEENILLQEQQQAEIDEILRQKKDRLREKREMAAANLAEKNRILEVEREQREEANRIEAEAIRLKTEQIATALAEKNRQLEEDRRQREDLIRKEKERKRVLEEAQRKKEQERRLAKSNKNDELFYFGTFLAIRLGYNVLGMYIGPKKDSDKP